jgi:hypothetical protein
MTIDKRKTYKTQDGREVRIYAVDGMGHLPIHGAVLSSCRPKEWKSEVWTEKGYSHSREDKSLVEATHPSGIPLCLPDAHNYEGHTIELKGWGGKVKKGDKWASCRIGDEWESLAYALRPHDGMAHIQTNEFVITYIPIKRKTEEMTLETVCRLLGKNIKIIK